MLDAKNTRNKKYLSLKPKVRLLEKTEIFGQNTLPTRADKKLSSFDMLVDMGRKGMDNPNSEKIYHRVNRPLQEKLQRTPLVSTVIYSGDRQVYYRPIKSSGHKQSIAKRL